MKSKIKIDWEAYFSFLEEYFSLFNIAADSAIAQRNCDELVKTEVLNAELKGYKAHDGLSVGIEISSKKELTPDTLVYEVSIGIDEVSQEEIDGEKTDYTYESWSGYQLEIEKESFRLKNITVTGRAG